MAYSNIVVETVGKVGLIRLNRPQALNALNAALAVVRWKRLRGVYADLEREHHAIYEVDGNTLLNEELG